MSSEKTSITPSKHWRRYLLNEGHLVGAVTALVLYAAFGKIIVCCYVVGILIAWGFNWHFLNREEGRSDRV